MRKLRDGFDYVEIDPKGEDRLAHDRRRTVDDADRRNGRVAASRSTSARSVPGFCAEIPREVLGWIGERDVNVLLVNIFAGITDLAEFAKLLCLALERTPSFSARWNGTAVIFLTMMQ